MKEHLKKLCLITAVSLTATVLVGCSPSADTASAENNPQNSTTASLITLTEDYAEETVKLNMPIADKFYAIYNRCSLPFDKSVSVADANGFSYSPVESIYDTLASLKADTEKYFTKDFLDSSFYRNLADETAFYKDIDGKLFVNTDAVSDGKNIWDTTTCVITDLTESGFTATVPYLDLYEAHRSARIEYVLDGDSYKINKWEMNLDAING